MLIPAFWCGVVATILTEVAAIVTAIFVYTIAAERRKTHAREIEIIPQSIL